MTGRMRLLAQYSRRTLTTLGHSSCIGSLRSVSHYPPLTCAPYSTDVPGVDTQSRDLAEARQNLHNRCSNFLKLCSDAPTEKNGSVDLAIGPEIAEIKINNPSKKNAFSGPMFLDLDKVVTQLEAWQDGKAVIMYGEKDSFCSGMELEFARSCTTGAKMGVEMSLYMQNILSRLNNLPIIVVGMIRGVAHGGGAEISTACDFRILTKNAEIKFLHAKMGITTGWGGASRLGRIIGYSKAFQFLSSSKPINAANCRQLQFAELICNDSEGLEMAKAWLEDFFLKAPSDVIRNYKKMMRAWPDFSLEKSYELETNLLKETWASKKHVQAIQTVQENLNALNALKTKNSERSQKKTTEKVGVA